MGDRHSESWAEGCVRAARGGQTGLLHLAGRAATAFGLVLLLGHGDCLTLNVGDPLALPRARAHPFQSNPLAYKDTRNYLKRLESAPHCIYVFKRQGGTQWAST
jgi:hypothetical protein